MFCCCCCCCCCHVVLFCCCQRCVLWNCDCVCVCVCVLRCDPGWDGPGCERCVPMPGCLHGSCHQPWQCSCQPGWAGHIHVCSREKPCQNGATCVLDGGGEYSCLCPEGFHGRNCQLKAGPCHRRRSPCKNGGLCEDNGGFASELTCHCLAGFTGPRCETDLDDCSMKPCANGATCIDGVNRFSCLCPDGFTGRFCTVNLDDCASGPCLNGGRCLDRVGAFRCLCRPGFTGATCEVVLWSRKPDDTGGNSGGDGSTTSSSFHGDRLFKVSVKEVVTQQGAVALSELQLVTLLVLGGITSAVVALTAGLVLRGRCRGRGRPTPPQGGPTGSERECKISFLNGAEDVLQQGTEPGSYRAMSG
uniref:Delta like non-canonical Notch ligand 2 n=1 Tax=Myripristis murdjan TaxID=586833 RepID=A0A667XCA8_9TELE